MRVITRSSSKTLAFGRKISRYLKKGDVICLYGPLGCGKTVLAKGIAWGLGIKKDSVISPTFVLLRRHADARMVLNHFDLYRLNSDRQILGLGYEEHLYGEGVSVIEWADKLGCLMPAQRLDIRLSHKGGQIRSIDLSFKGARYRKLLEDILENIGH